MSLGAGIVNFDESTNFQGIHEALMPKRVVAVAVHHQNPNMVIRVLTFLGFGKSLNASKGIQSQILQVPTIDACSCRDQSQVYLFLSSSWLLFIRLSGNRKRLISHEWLRDPREPLLPERRARYSGRVIKTNMNERDFVLSMK